MKLMKPYAPIKDLATGPQMVFDKGKVSVICSCGKQTDLPISIEQYFDWKRKGTFIQEEFPELTPGQRELLLSGICEKCWDKMFKEDDED